MAREEIGDGEEKKQGKKRRTGDGAKDGNVGDESMRRGFEESRRSRRSISSGRGSSITSSGSYYGGSRGSGEGNRGHRQGPLHPAFNDFGEVVGNSIGNAEERDGQESNEKGAVQSYAEAESLDRPPVRRHTAPARRGSRIGEGMVD